jgi:hypothetical protein
MIEECRPAPRHDRRGRAVIGFTLSAFVGIAGVVGGACGGKIDGTGPAPSATTTTTSVPPSEPTKRPPPPPPREEDPFDPGDCPKDVQLTNADLDSQIGWKSPAAPAAGACTNADITQLETNFKDTSLQSWFDLGKSLSDTCKSCVFSKDTDPNWSMIVGTAADNGQTGFLNLGACYASVEGPPCGKAIQYQQFCNNVACNECSNTQAELAKCVKKAETTACASFSKNASASCPKLADSMKECATIFDGVRRICG